MLHGRPDGPLGYLGREFHDGLMAPSSSRLEPPRNPLRFHAMAAQLNRVSGRCTYCNGAANPFPENGLTCRDCGSVMVANRPTEHELFAFYAEYVDGYHGGGRDGGAVNRQVRWAKAYLRIVRKYSNGGSLLDVGCANSPFPNLAAGARFMVTATDVHSPPTLEPNVVFVAGSLDFGLPLEPVTFDAVTCWAVLEHCLKTHAAVIALARMCRPGGHVFLSTPQIGVWADRYGAGRTPWFYPPEHLNLVSVRALRGLIRRRLNRRAAG